MINFFLILLSLKEHPLTSQEKLKRLFLMMFELVLYFVEANVVVIVNVSIEDLHMGLHQIGYG